MVDGIYGMNGRIGGLGSSIGVSGQTADTRPEKKSPTFTERLSSAVSSVNRSQMAADTAARQVVRGELGVHEGMMALMEADLSMRLLMQVRTKAVQAYQEISRMAF
ncbi:MAG: flagellar hook-basal body complex protein FliE [Deltaproteobacteria bacterium]|nr:MAG: flagellar hook-basal body complex protein FliE [Deltaproteobacteria bacterium]